MHTHSQQHLWIYSTMIEEEENLSELGLVPTCSSYAPNMQHEFIRERLEGLDEEEGE